MSEEKEIVFPLVCPKCESTNVEEVVDGQWSSNSYEWNKDKKRYEEYDEDIDGDGSARLQCADCGHEYEYEEYQKWMEQNLECFSWKARANGFDKSKLFEILGAYMNNQTKEQWEETVIKLQKEFLIDAREVIE